MNELRDRLQNALGSNYALERELGGGGMSRVFVATETALGRQVVIKVLPPELEGAVSAERFRREIALAARLQHPTIVPLLTAGEADGLLYYTMPFIEGTTLRAAIERDGALPVERATRILRDVLEALSYAHAHGVVHRDIKPENVLLAPHHAVVSDFGVAKALAAAGGTDAVGRTTAGLVIGSPSYMAPEQAAADPTTDHRADLYAVGVMGYEMLTGAGPFPGRTPSQTMAAHMVERPEPLGSKRSGVPAALAALVMRLLEKSPADRPQSGEEALAALGTETIGHRPSVIGKRVGIGIAIAAIGAAGFGIVRWKERATPRAERRAPSIAVLPFEDESPAHDNAYLSDGMSEDLIGALSKVPGLRVVGRSSSFAFKGQNSDVREVGRRLDVGSVLEGSVQRSGDKLRVSAQLIDAVTGTVTWTARYDRDLRDVFALQDSLSSAIVRELSVRLAAASPATAAPTGDVEAYTLYLQGRYFWNRRTKESLQTALGYFGRAIVRDSGYARAYAGIADVYNVMGGFYYEPPLVAWPKGKAAALKALSLDPDLPEAHAALAFVHLYYDWDGAAARREAERAIALDPNYPLAHMYYSYYFGAAEKFDSALAQMGRARALDPLSLIINVRYGDALYSLHRYDDALAQYRNVWELDSTYPALIGQVPYLLVVKGDVKDALKEYGRLDRPGHPYLAGGRTMAYARAGFLDSARAVLSALLAKDLAYRDDVNLAYSYLALGDRDSAFAMLDRGAGRRSVGVTILAGDPMLDPLRGDPRYAALRRRMGLAEVTAPR